MCPKIMKEPIRTLCETAPSYIGLDERFIRQKADPTELDERVRLTFWDEFHQASVQGRKMHINNVINSHTTTIEVLVRDYLRKPGVKLAYIITPPRRYGTSMRILLDKGMRRMEEILDMPLKLPNGNPNAALISQVIKAFQLIDLRVKGAVIQKMQIQQQNLNLNADIGGDSTDAQLLQNLASMSLDDLEQLEAKVERLGRMEKKATASLPLEDQLLIRDMKEGISRKEGTYDVEAFEGVELQPSKAKSRLAHDDSGERDDAGSEASGADQDPEG